MVSKHQNSEWNIPLQQHDKLFRSDIQLYQEWYLQENYTAGSINKYQQQVTIMYQLSTLLYNTHYKYCITCLTYLIKNHPSSSSQRWRSLTIITASACISGYNSVIYHTKHTGAWLERLSHEASLLTWQRVSSIFIYCSDLLPYNIFCQF